MLGRVDLVVAAVRELHLDVDDGITRQHAARERLAHAPLDGRHELARHGAAHGVILEDDAAALRGRDVEHDVAVLAAPARLPNVLALGGGTPAHGLAVGDLRPAHVGLDLELAHEAVDDDLEVQLAHAGDEGLPRLGVGAHTERRILHGELLQRERELFLVGLRLRLDCDRDDRLGKLHDLEHDGRLGVRERVARGA